MGITPGQSRKNFLWPFLPFIMDEDKAGTTVCEIIDYSGKRTPLLTGAMTDSITANAGGGQANAAQLNTGMNRVTVVASQNDSVALPASVLGRMVTVINAGANSLQIYGMGTDTINGVASATGIPQIQGSVEIYFCPVAGSWVSLGTGGMKAGLETLSAQSGITAGTTRTQGGATVLSFQVNRVDTSTAPAAGSLLGDGVVLPAAAAGMFLVIWNNTANPIQVYGNGSDTVNAVAGSTGVALPPNAVEMFYSAAAGSWAYDAGIGTSGQLPTMLSLSGITAGTTRTQGGATALTADFNRVDTSTAPAAGALLGDGVKLPASAAGLDIVIWNNTNNPIQVYGAGSDTVNAVAGSTGVALPPNAIEVFACMVAGSWQYDAGMGTSGQLPTVLALDGISAAGGGQAGATQLTADFNRITTATALQGVALPKAKAGLDIIVENHTGVTIVVYGNNAAADKIDDVATGTGIQQMDSSVVIYTCYADGNWYTNGAATGYAKNPTAGVVLETMQYADNLTAVSGGIGSALQLNAAINTIGTCPSGGGVILPVSAPGLQVTVINNGVNALLVFGDTTNTPTVNGATNTVGVLILPGTAATFNCTNANAWTTMPASTKMTTSNTNSSTISATLTAANVTGGVANVDLAMTGTLAANVNATLPTVASVVALLHSPTVGTSYRLRISNQSGNAPPSFSWTVLTNTGWTLSGNMVIPQGMWADFDVSLTSLSAATLTFVDMGPFLSLPDAQFVTNSGAGAQTAAVGDLTGAKTCHLSITAVGAANYTTRTGAQMVADIPNAYVGFCWTVIVKNTNAGTTTIVAGASGITLNGTMTVAQNTARIIAFRITASNTIVGDSMGVTATV